MIMYFLCYFMCFLFFLCFLLIIPFDIIEMEGILMEDTTPLPLALGTGAAKPPVFLSIIQERQWRIEQLFM